MTVATTIKGPTLSFEIFPPNTQVGEEKIMQTLGELKGLAPQFISVTCSNKAVNIEDSTVRLVSYVQNQLHVPAIAHLPALYLSKEQVRSLLSQLDQLGVHKLLALRGDVVPEIPLVGDFHYASDLIHFIKEEKPHFDISAACYPEVHPDSSSVVSDLRYLKEKTDAGCSQLITQLFLDNDVFYRFQERCDLSGIHTPILAGIMPIINRPQALRLLQATATKVPRKFQAILERYEHNPEALHAAGLAYALDQIVDLVTHGVSGVHLYTMNRADTANYIMQSASALFQMNDQLRTA